MESTPPTASPSKKMIWTGRVLSALPVLMLVLSGVMKLVAPPDVVKGFDHLGWPLKIVAPLGIVELACTVIYLIPSTAILGAILLTGYFGGAIAATVRVGDSFIAQFVLGVLLWGGLYLRDPRLRALIPLVRK